MKKSFSCEKCGACCSHLKEFGSYYADLDDGNGVCKFYDCHSRLCIIYASRPSKCRIEESYARFALIISWNEYIKITKEGCKLLQEKSFNSQSPHSSAKSTADG